MRIEQVTEATPELVATIERLLPQLSEARTPPTLEELAADGRRRDDARRRGDDGADPRHAHARLYRVSSGLKARIEDVIVDEAARGQGIGEALVREAHAPRDRARRAHGRAHVDAVPRVGEPPLPPPRLRPQADERLRLVAR